MKLKSLLAGAAGIAFSSAAMASGGYGTAGCGLGAMAFKEQPGKIQIVAATLNNLISPQTFAITSGTSNCSDYDSKTASAQFIDVNKQALLKDISRGGGETVAGLSRLMKCSDEALFAEKLRQSLGSMMSDASTSSVEISDSISNTVRSDAELSKTCATII